MFPVSLPEPAAVDQRHSLQLSEAIASLITESNGWIGFDQFMELILYAPELGYYSGRLQKFGATGDFITAPLMGDLFARCIASQCADIITTLQPKNNRVCIYEFGAGTATLAVDLLSALAAIDRLPQQYVIIETSAWLQQRQAETVSAVPAEIRERIVWHAVLPQKITGIVLANELIDAIPCKRFEVDRSGAILELGVALDNRAFRWASGAVIDADCYRFDTAALAAGYQSELGLRAKAWVATIGALLQQGVMLLIDYGFAAREFYHPQRAAGTLMCHYRHHAHSEPFWWPGLQDVTAHVDFTAVARAGKQAGMDLAGYCNQANFLLSCGLIDILAASQPAVDSGDENAIRRRLALASEVKQLTMPHQMGELFKVIALTKQYPHPLKGFSQRNNIIELLDD